MRQEQVVRVIEDRRARDLVKVLQQLCQVLGIAAGEHHQVLLGVKDESLAGIHCFASHSRNSSTARGPVTRYFAFVAPSQPTLNVSPSGSARNAFSSVLSSPK